MMHFHIASHGRTEGPLTEDEVRRRVAAGSLQPVDHCWSAGWEHWRPVYEVFPDAVQATTPPPLASWESLASQPADEAADRRRRMPVRHDRTSGALFLAVGGLVAVTFLIIAVWVAGGGGEKDAKPAEEKPQISRGRLAAERRAGLQRAEPTPGSRLQEMDFSGTNLEQIAQACLAYARAHGGELPSYTDELRPLFGTRFDLVMDVPETPIREAGGYAVCYGINTSMPGNTPIAFEARPRKDGSRAVAFLNGRVRVLAAGDPDLARALGR